MDAPGLTPSGDVHTPADLSPDLVLQYGPEPEHIADVRLPPEAREPGPLVIFLHGGFWRASIDRTHTGPLATALAAAGYAVCVPEFRRTGQPGGGWPGTFDDAAAAVDQLPGLLRAAAGPGTVADGPTLLAGHSAGGHLALWAAGRHHLPAGSSWRLSRPATRGVVALGAVSCLADSHDRRLGNGAADALMGGSPAAFPDRYSSADPLALLPLGCPLQFVHGTLDDVVPPDLSRNFAGRARAAGDQVTVTELPGIDHMAVIDPLSPAWPAVMAAFTALAPPAAAAAG